MDARAATGRPTGNPYTGTTAAERSDAVSQLSALMCATQAELLRVVAAVDAEKDWAADGATGAVPWLMAMCGLSLDHARDWVHAARALEDLPCLRAAFAAGELSWDQVRPATRFATPDTDAAVLAEILGLSARQVEVLARQRRPITRPEAQDVERQQSLTIRADRRRGGVRLTAQLTADQGAAVAAALERHAEQMGPDARTGRWDPLPRRLALALHDLASRALAADPDPDLACVVIHADAAVVDGAVVGNGTVGDCSLSLDGVLRAMCDARVEAHLHGPDGATVGVARATRTIPRWLRRSVRGRDGTCRFPGCERAIRQIHHIVHWARGGPTNADNLVGLCWAHHTLVHEYGWHITGDPDGTLTFSSTGRRMSSRPDPLRRSTGELFLGGRVGRGGTGPP